MRPKSLILLALALGCGLIASLGINQVMSRGNTPVADKGEMEPIYVALKDIEINDPITPEQIKLEKWPKDKLPPGALTKLEDVENRRVRSKLYAGEPILDKKLLKKGEENERATDHIPPGYRVVAVKVDAAATGGYIIKPGDRVDLLVHLVRNLSKGIPETTTKTFLQDVKVFAVNDIITDTEGKGTITAKTVSLLVKPEQSELVTHAARLGGISLSIRPPHDEEVVETDGGTASDIFGMTEEHPAADPNANSADIAKQLQSWFGSMKNQLTPVADAKVEEPKEEEFQMTVFSGTAASEVTLVRDGKSGQWREAPNSPPAVTYNEPNMGQMPSSYPTAFPPGIPPELQKHLDQLNQKGLPNLGTGSDAGQDSGEDGGDSGFEQGFDGFGQEASGPELRESFN